MADEKTPDHPTSDEPVKDASYDDENRFGQRVKRYARVNAGMGGFVARAAGGSRLLGGRGDNDVARKRPIWRGFWAI